jgi:DDE superfamily endonuclease
MAQYLILDRLSNSRRNTISTHLTSINWPAQFIKRHPYLQGLITKSIERPRINACTPEVFKQWFDIYQMHFEKYQPKASDIYNIDETGFILGDGEKRYVIIDRRLGASQIAKGKKGEFLTVIECVSATGTSIPPMVIYKGEYLQGHWFDSNAPRDWMVATSSKGWTSNALGLKWLQDHFEPATRTNGYRFLILDGHGSHIAPEFQDFCEQYRIVLLCLPAHTSHMLQPLDIAVFSPLKHYFRRTVEKRLRAGALKFPKTEFLETYQVIRPQAITEKNIKSGFRKASLVPFNPTKALERLPTASTPTVSPQRKEQTQTPKTQQDVQQALENLGSTAREATAKIGKAAGIFYARTILAEKEAEELIEETKKIQEAASRKRKKVPKKGPQLIGDVLDSLAQQNQGRSKGTKRGGRVTRQ